MQILKCKNGVVLMHEAERHEEAIRRAMDGARHAAGEACEPCWYRRRGKCRGTECPIYRVLAEAEKCCRMMRKGRLLPNWYTEAKRAQTLAEVPFIEDEEARA